MQYSHYYFILKWIFVVTSLNPCARKLLKIEIVSCSKLCWTLWKHGTWLRLICHMNTIMSLHEHFKYCVRFKHIHRLKSWVIFTENSQTTLSFNFWSTINLSVVVYIYIDDLMSFIDNISDTRRLVSFLNLFL